MAPTIKLIRHGESEANINAQEPREVGDHNIVLTDRGRAQAAAAGEALGRDFFENALIYVSPYQRTRQTLSGALDGAGLDEAARDSLTIYEDPRIREVEHGYGDVGDQMDLRKTHGWFYYRFEGGESPADCYDRTSSFLESLMRQVERKDSEHVLVVSHGLTIRCFAMRFLHLTVEEFDTLANPDNCAIITIADSGQVEEPVYSRGRWAMSGLSLRDD